MKERLHKLRQEMKKRSLEAFLVTDPVNRRYLSGFDGSHGILLIGDAEAFLCTDFRYLEQAEKQAPHFTILPWKSKLGDLLKSVVEEADWSVLAFEEEQVTYSLYRQLQTALPAELKPQKGLVEDLRAVKTDDEINRLEKGAAMMDRAFEYILGLAEPGMTEQELSLELEYYLRRRGSTETLFKYIVASGTRGSLPHGIASEKKMGRGELVTVDFTGTFEGYATDMTRTFALGEPEKRALEIYEIVRLAQQEAREKMGPGLTGREADALARGVIEDAGYGEHFGHGLGHGLGLEVHERPTLSPRGEETLAPGMVVTIEPGIYIPGWGGVRIEDMVVITPEGARSLTRYPRKLIVI